MGTNEHTSSKEDNQKQEGTAVNTNMQPSGIPANLRLAEAADNKMGATEAIKPTPTDEQMDERWRILTEPHNMLMLRGITRQLVAGTADREELLDSLMMKLAVARCNTQAEQAVLWLDNEDGAEVRRRAYRRCFNLGRTLARTMITQRDREVCTDFNDVQMQAVTAAFKNDAPWQTVRSGYKDRDEAAWFANKAVAERFNDGEPLDWRNRLFHRRAEGINEKSTGGWAFNGKEWVYDTLDGRAKTTKVIERSLMDMLTDTMHPHGLHDWGRLERDDALTLKYWVRSFMDMVPEPRPGMKKEDAERLRLITARADWLGTVNGRQGALLALSGGQAGTTGHEHMALLAILHGEVTSVGSLAAACTWGTIERRRKGRNENEETEHTPVFMEVHTSLMCKLLGLEASRSNRRTLDNLLVRMAKEAGASADIDKLSPERRSQFNRFPLRYKQPHRELGMLLDIHAVTKQRGCTAKVFIDSYKQGRRHASSGMVASEANRLAFQRRKATSSGIPVLVGTRTTMRRRPYNSASIIVHQTRDVAKEWRTGFKLGQRDISNGTLLHDADRWSYYADVCGR